MNNTTIERTFAAAVRHAAARGATPVHRHHSVHADGVANDHPAVFAEYAGSRIWTAVHVGQFRSYGDLARWAVRLVLRPGRSGDAPHDRAQLAHGPGHRQTRASLSMSRPYGGRRPSHARTRVRSGTGPATCNACARRCAGATTACSMLWPCRGRGQAGGRRPGGVCSETVTRGAGGGSRKPTGGNTRAPRVNLTASPRRCARSSTGRSSSTTRSGRRAASRTRCSPARSTS
jgi:hypothetical protein